MNLKIKCGALTAVPFWIIFSLTVKGHDFHETPQIKFDSLESIRNKIADLDNRLIDLKIDDINTRALYFAELDSLATLYQQLGMEFWNKYPNDNRKYTWFKVNTINSINHNHYWKNRIEAAMNYVQNPKQIHQYTAEVDLISYNQNETKLDEMAKEFFKHFGGLSGFDLTSRLRSYYLDRLRGYLNLCQNTEFRPSKSVMLDKIKFYFLEAAKADSFGVRNLRDGQLPLMRDYYRLLTESFLTRIDEFGLTPSDIVQFINSFENENNSILAEWQQTNLKLFSAYHNPLPFEGQTTKGKYLNISDFRGQVVLLDFWSIGCSSCIAAFPKVNQLLNKYKEKGFNVVAACAAGKNSIDKVEKINADKNIRWETVILSDDDTGKSFSFKYLFSYSFFAFPRYLLLDREGKILSYSFFLDPDIEGKIIAAL